VKLRDPNATSLAETIRRVLASSRVVFAGPSGAGKTSLAIACLRERAPHGLFVSALRIGTARIQSHAGQGEAALVEQAIAAPLLLLDEVGGEQKTATNAVRDVIFARYDADLPTWITTGFKGGELAAMYGDGALRRLTEHAYVVQLGKS
jgi:DNA replication protein DnaC